MADHRLPSRRRSSGRRPARRTAALAATLAVVAAVGLAVATRAAWRDERTTGAANPIPGTGTTAPSLNADPVALSTFDSCPALLEHYRSTALPLVGPWGMAGGPTMFGVGPQSAELARRSATDTLGGSSPAAAAPQSAAGTASTDSTSTSGTTVQVAGVDEADLAKRSGDLLLVIAQPTKVVELQAPGAQGSALVVLHPSGDRDHRTATRLARLELGWSPSSLLVEGDTVLLIGTDYRTTPVASDSMPSRIMPVPGIERTRLEQVDLTDPARPRVVRTLTVDGSAAGARMVDGVARLAVTSWPTLTFDNPYAGVSPDTPVTSPENPTSSVTAPDGAPSPVPMPRATANPQEIEKQATERNRDRVRASAIDDWLPRYDLVSGGEKSSGRLVDCTQVAAPRDPAGVATLTMLTLDLREHGIGEWQSTAVVASGSTVYATAERTYVATSSAPWAFATGRTDAPIETALHVFDTSGRDRGSYLASGTVTGTLLNQFSMDEYDGVLRVATTDSTAFWGGPILMDDAAVATVPPLVETQGAESGQARPSPAATRPPVPQSRVTTLRRDGRRLVRLGEVDGLGPTERIHAVRFTGPIGYVVTFRQTDPLYTLDLSDPARPVTRGELKIPGYSAYLHPAADGLLLGVGQDATDQGRVTGLSLSLFDVSDLTDPRRVARVKLSQAFSGAEGDHHAFTLAGDLALIPFQQYADANGQPRFDAGVLAVRRDGERLGEPTVLRMRADGPITLSPNGFEPAMMTDVPQRTMVVDGTIWTIGAGAVSAHDASNLARTGYTAFD
ncbi:MAG: beta-propeller domain-containing protein [Kineosporiaceae bacterium]|nr:beta-propeller domain-containing protein [Kineosporiaceae bacterium]